MPAVFNQVISSLSLNIFLIFLYLSMKCSSFLAIIAQLIIHIEENTIHVQSIAYVATISLEISVVGCKSQYQIVASVITEK